MDNQINTDKQKQNESAGRKIFAVCQNIKKLRIHHGMSVKELAKVMGIQENKLILTEACAYTDCLDIRHIARLCDYFHIEMDEILSENLFK